MRLGTLEAPLGYRFAAADPAFPIPKVVVRTDRLVVEGDGAVWRYALDEPMQGRVALRLTLGHAVRWCAEAPARLSGDPPSAAADDHVDRFNGERSVLPPAVCPPVG